jgi:hypothetical protein
MPRGGRAPASDWAWELDEFAGARQEIAQLPDDPLQAIIGELLARYVEERAGTPICSGWCSNCPAGPACAAGAKRTRAPASRRSAWPISWPFALVLERLYGEQLVRRIWDLPLSLAALGRLFRRHAAELQVRHAFGKQELPEDLLKRCPLLASPGRRASNWRAAAGSWPPPLPPRSRDDGEPRTSKRAGRLAAFRPRASGSVWAGGNCARSLTAGAQALLDCAASLSRDQRGQVWLLAYEHHYRQQIFAALAANHGRMPRRWPARPKRSSSSAWTTARKARAATSKKSIRLSKPSAPPVSSACRCSGRASTTRRRAPVPDRRTPDERRSRRSAERQRGGTAAHQRRRTAPAWRERLHQGSRRGWLQAALLTAAAGPVALLALLARTLAPARFGRRSRASARPSTSLWRRAATDRRRPAKPSRRQRRAPRLGFSEEEQVARVGGFLRSIGLTSTSRHWC